MVPPSNFIRKLRRKSQLEEYLARNPEVPIDSTVTNFSAPKKGSATFEVVVAAAPKLVNGTPDVGEASLPARSSSPPVRLSARRLSQAASRNDAFISMTQKDMEGALEAENPSGLFFKNIQNNDLGIWAKYIVGCF